MASRPPIFQHQPRPPATVPAPPLPSSDVDVDVLIVGAGLSGVGAARSLQASCPWASFVVLEARGAIGGTWDLFRYPGVRSDSDMFTLGYSSKPWQGEGSIADGASIRRYIEEAATETGVVDHIRFHHRVVAAQWSSDEARWQVTVHRADTGATVQFTCGFLFACTGYYRYDQGYLPDFVGMDRFAGTIVHPQDWPEDLDCNGRKVAVIGSGATAVTLVPSLAAAGAQVTMVQRSPTYIMSLPAEDALANLVRRWLPPSVAGPTLRWIRAMATQGSYQLSRRYPKLVKRLLRRQVQRQLPPGYDIDTHFTPRYDPWDQRLCVVPDGDLFRAIRSGQATVVTNHIETFTETGLRLASGAEIDADIIVTATGLDLLFLGGMALSVDGQPVDPATKLAYKGMLLQDVPNLAFAIGYTNASWTLKCDLTCDSVCRLLNLMRQRGVRQCTPVVRQTTVAASPLLGLTSGYVQRAHDRMPKQGDVMPWQVRQSYLHDYRTHKCRPVDDPALLFTSPARSASPASPPVTTTAR